MNNKQFKRTRNRKNKKEKFILKFDENARRCVDRFEFEETSPGKLLFCSYCVITVTHSTDNGRREFLTGFHKRKLQKKAKAAEKLQEKLKLERKRLKVQTKMFYKNLMRSQKPVPEVSHLLTENIDLGEHCVTVTEVSPVAAAQECSWIGQNQVYYENNNKEKNEEEDQTNADLDDIDGMEILPRAKDSRKATNLSLKTTKDLKKAIKKKVTDIVKQSKVFRTKSKVAQIKDMKRKRREERRRKSKRKERAGSEDD